MNKVICLFLFAFLFASCAHKEVAPVGDSEDCIISSLDSIFKPFARYWWFASEMKKEDIRYNLNWLKNNGFGGVELAWVYPLNAMNKSLDTAYTPRQEWLSPEWQEVVAYTISYADSIGLACDMTLGSLWPFGDASVSYDEAAQRYAEQDRQIIRKSWQHPKTGYVVDHLNPKYYLNYFNRMLDSFPHPKTKWPQACFVDSWEVETKGLWTDGFVKDFEKRYGYDIRPYMDSLYVIQHTEEPEYEMEWNIERSVYSCYPKYADQLYDYMHLVSDKAIQFYRDFDSSLNVRGFVSRGQCSGAPCDIISAYACMDVPEGEALLYEPEFNRIPASAALLSGKKHVSAETFTCLYGWPRNYIRQEQTADLKLLADALFANGVNHIIWHGKPHNPVGQDTINFYASVHVGKDGSLAEEIPAFNAYLEKVSGYMKNGHTYSDMAVYLPTEDAWMKGEMPVKDQYIWAWGYYEMRYAKIADALKGYCPAWINKEFLEKAEVKNNELIVGDAVFKALYVDADYLDYESLVLIQDIERAGVPLIFISKSKQAGTQKNEDFNQIASSLYLHSIELNLLRSELPGIVEGEDLPPYWMRKNGNDYYIFFAHPKTSDIEFPLTYGQSFTKETVFRKLDIHLPGIHKTLNLAFKPYQSLLYKINPDGVSQIDIDFVPKTPRLGKPVPNNERNWLVDKEADQ
jgi:hypothetical protein